MEPQGINTLSSTPSLADRLLFVGWLFAEPSDSISRGAKRLKRTKSFAAIYCKEVSPEMYKDEDSLGLCATVPILPFLSQKFRAYMTSSPSFDQR